MEDRLLVVDKSVLLRKSSSYGFYGSILFSIAAILLAIDSVFIHNTLLHTIYLCLLASSITLIHLGSRLLAIALESRRISLYTLLSMLSIYSLLTIAILHYSSILPIYTWTIELVFSIASIIFIVLSYLEIKRLLGIKDFKYSSILFILSIIIYFYNHVIIFIASIFSLSAWKTVSAQYIISRIIYGDRLSSCEI